MYALYILSPEKPLHSFGNSPRHEQDNENLRINGKGKVAASRHIKFTDIVDRSQSEEELASLKVSLLDTYVALVDTMAKLWFEKPAFWEIISPFHQTLAQLLGKKSASYLPTSTLTKAKVVKKTLRALLAQAKLSRRPLRLHNHKPLAIKTSIPKFEESYNPSKHYDPDRERAEASKLRAEHKREKKGAMRELRKDANFIARQSLKEKKETDAAYEKKYRRIIAEIQGTEGHEAKQYEREKAQRKSSRR
jgi:nucleolar protein 14